jgi:formate dehydrogenase major subunit
VGCGVLCYVEDGKITAVEGDPDHPISEGALCSKGSGLFNMYYIMMKTAKSSKTPRELLKFSTGHQKPRTGKKRDWDWAIAEIAKRTKATRDEYFKEKNASGQTVNRCEALAWVGSAMCNNEENYLYQKVFAGPMESQT